MVPSIAIAGPSRGVVERLDGSAVECLPVQQHTVVSADYGSPSMSAASSVQHQRQRRGSNSASMSNSSDSASLRSAAASWQASIRSGTSKEKGGGLWSRRGSVAPKSLRSTRSKGSTRSGQREGSIASGSEQAFEMTAVPLGGRGQKKVIENEATRQKRAKADAAMAKWRWIVEERPRAEFDNPLYASRSMSLTLGATAGPSSECSPLRSMTPNAPPSALPAHVLSSPPGSSRQNWADTVGTASSVNSYASASYSRHLPSTPNLPQQHHLLGVQDIYLSESVRQLRDVELAIDPAFLGQGIVNGRRLSTHPRMSERENPFHTIHGLISRRGIRPFVLELVQALAAFIDAVWSVNHPGQPCPWAGVPQISRRPSYAGALHQSKMWCSWTLAAVQEGKRQGFLNDPPTENDVIFWNREVRYGLRDIDEAVHCRKDLGWAFGKTVIEGQYGDIIAANVFAQDGVSAGNMARLLNDLEEVLWGDAIPAPSDLAFEHDPDFDPFSVYREGDELIGVEVPRQLEEREAELRRVFGDYLPSQIIPPTSPVSSVPPGSRKGSRSAPTSSLEDTGPTSRGPATGSGGMPDLDLSALGSLQELSLEEKMQLGRKRHQEYLERVRAEAVGSSGAQTAQTAQPA